MCSLACGAAHAQELLQNRSFENPVASADGNNFYATIPSWTVTPNLGGATPVNIVKAWSGYANNPTITPSGGGAQYLDINSDSGVIKQAVTLPDASVIDYSIWFSVRDYAQDISGLTVNIRNSSNVIVSSASTSFTVSDPIGLWKQTGASNVTLPAGIYSFEVTIPDYANVDLASLVYKPPLQVSKTSIAYTDPVNHMINPKQIPGGITQYSILITNPGTLPVANNSIAIVDTTPSNLSLVVTDIGTSGSGPAALIQGSTSSTLTYNFSGLSSTTDDIEFSNNGGTSYTYTPVADANGVDSTVTNVRINPKGAMAQSSSFTIRLRYLIK